MPYALCPTPSVLSPALKEWAAVIDAMERGTQVLTLRKGGIREKSVLLEDRGFYLLPTFEHQAIDLIKPAFRDGLLNAIAVQRNEHGLVVRTHAEVADAWEVDDAERLAALEPLHMFSADYARARYDWRPKKPLTVLLLRVYRLAAPWQTGLAVGTGGCRSWLDLDASTASAVAAPVLTDAAFKALAEPVRALLGVR
jgi:hypothetical protein